MMRELMTRPDFLVCTIDEGDVMDGENLSPEEALSRRFLYNEKASQRQFLRQYFEDERRTKPQFRAGGDTPSDFKLSEDLARLKVKGVVCDAIKAMHEAFVADLDDDWTNSTRLMVAIGRCKALIHNRTSVGSPYESKNHMNKAFWRTVCAGQTLKIPYHSPKDTGEWSEDLHDHLLKSQSDMWSSWLPETPSTWENETPTLTVLEANRLEFTELNVAIQRVHSIMFADVRGTLRQMMRGAIVDKLELADNEWSETERLLYRKRFKELAELWQTQPYDLYHRPFDLPGVSHTRLGIRGRSQIKSLGSKASVLDTISGPRP